MSGLNRPKRNPLSFLPRLDDAFVGKYTVSSLSLFLREAKKRVFTMIKGNDLTVDSPLLLPVAFVYRVDTKGIDYEGGGYDDNDQDIFHVTTCPGDRSLRFLRLYINCINFSVRRGVVP